MDDVPVTPVAGSLFETSGWYGTTVWSPPKELHDILPAAEREQALRVWHEKVIKPFVDQHARQLLAQAGSNCDPAALSTEWSLETLSLDCGCVGRFEWLVGQGCWDEFPADTRDNLLMLAKVLYHGFFQEEVSKPLFIFAARRLRGD